MCIEDIKQGVYTNLLKLYLQLDKALAVLNLTHSQRALCMAGLNDNALKLGDGSLKRGIDIWKFMEMKEISDMGNLRACK